jgi:hypothetical protein
MDAELEMIDASDAQEEDEEDLDALLANDDANDNVAVKSDDVSLEDADDEEDW